MRILKTAVAGLALILPLAGCGGSSNGTLSSGGNSGGGGGGAGASGLIAFRGTVAGAGDIFTVPASGGTPVNRTQTPQEEQAPAISPDRTQIAYYRRTGNNALTSELWVMNADGTGQRKLADGAPFFEPDWSPDGTKIAFYGRGNSVQVITVASGAIVTLVAATNQNGEVAWTSDGTKIVFDAAAAGGGRNINIINANGAGAATVLIANATSPDISPDGTKIVFRRNNGIFIQNSDGSGTATSLVADGIDADFGPDGTYIVYVAQRGGGGGAEGSANLFLLTIAGGVETQLTSNGDALSPAWS